MCLLHCSLYFKMISSRAINKNAWEEGRGGEEMLSRADTCTKPRKPKRNVYVLYFCIKVCM